MSKKAISITTFIKRANLSTSAKDKIVEVLRKEDLIDSEHVETKTIKYINVKKEALDRANELIQRYELPIKKSKSKKEEEILEPMYIYLILRLDKLIVRIHDEPILEDLSRIDRVLARSKYKKVVFNQVFKDIKKYATLASQGKEPTPTNTNTNTNSIKLGLDFLPLAHSLIKVVDIEPIQ